MRARIQKWGNALAVQIPQSFAEQAGLRENGQIDISLVGRTVLIESIAPEVTLDALPAHVTEDNRHGAVESGPTVGTEAW